VKEDYGADRTMGLLFLGKIDRNFLAYTYSCVDSFAAVSVVKYGVTRRK